MRISDWSSDVCSSDLVVDIPGRRLTKREFKLNTNLAEPTLENYQLASNGGTISTGSGFKAYDPTQDNSGATPTYKALIFDGFGPNSLKRRVIARRVQIGRAPSRAS